MLTSRTNLLLIVATLGCAGLNVMGCEANVPVHDNTADVHDNEVNADVDVDADFDFEADVDEVEAGDTVSVSMNATGVVLVKPDEQPPAEDKDRAAHFKIFLDDASASPLVVTASASVSVTIPPSVPAGKHKLICRMYRHDGAELGDAKEVSINVKASASVNAGSAGAGGTM